MKTDTRESSALVEEDPLHEDDRKTKTRHTGAIPAFLSDSWGLEYAAMSISIVALGSIATLLVFYDKKPLSTWSSFFSINAVLSILVIVLKTAMMVPVASCLGQLKWLWYWRKRQALYDFEVFDRASRGPWGSILLLARLKTWHLASTGAVITVFALVSGSFVQQAVSYPLWNVTQPHLIASVPYAQGYTADMETITGLEHLMAGIYDGVFSSNLTHTSSSLQAACPSGNCTFPPYASLGMCSKCADVTNLLQNKTFAAGNGWGLPNGHFLVGQLASAVNITNSAAQTWSVLPLNSDALTSYNTDGLLLNASIIIAADLGLSGESAQARDCVLFFCARSYEASYASNVFFETITGAYTPPEWEQGTHSEYAFTVPPHAFPGPDWASQDLVFALDLHPLQHLTAALAALSGVGAQILNSIGVSVETSSNVPLAFVYQGANGTTAARIFENVATALTNALRQIPQTYIRGTTYALKTHIAVQWLWLILPLVMVLLALVFLVLTVLQSKRSGIPNWRTSALAVMEHGVNTTMLGTGPAEKADVTGVANGRKIEQWARDVHVKLQRRGGNVSEFGLSVSNGRLVHQEVNNVHFHVIPNAEQEGEVGHRIVGAEDRYR